MLSGCARSVVALEASPLNGADIVRQMYERHRTVIAGSRNKLSGRVIRIGTMGCVMDEDIETDLDHLRTTIRDLPPPLRAGL